MIIEIDKEYQEKLIRKGIDTKDFPAFEDLLNLSYKNKLFFKAELRFYQFLLEKYKKELSVCSQRFLHFVIEKYSVIKSEINNIDSLILLVENGDKDLSSYFAVCTIDNLPKDYTPTLYCENIEDTHFYLKVFEALDGGRQSIFIKEDAFGGGNIATVEHRVREGDILFCVCDSDKKYPTADLGSTATKLKNLFVNERHRFSYYYILNVREIENLIPYDCLISDDNITDPEVIKLIEILVKCSDETKDFFDIKSGYDKETRKKYLDNNDWLEVNKKVIASMKYCHMYHASAADVKLIKGIGENIIKQLNKEAFKKEHFLSPQTNNQNNDILFITKQIKRFGFIYRYSNV